jgi:5-methylcytosine-specific restriction protein B
VTLRPEYASNKFRQNLFNKGASPDMVDRIVGRMASLNDDISADKTNLGPGFCIGHSFFCSAASDEALDEKWYRRIISTEIVPLLEEYWFDNQTRADEWRDRLMAD